MMLSNDQNIETFAELVEKLKHYLGLQTEYIKLDVIEKVVKLITAIATILVITIIVIFVTIFLSFALAYALGPLMGKALGFVVVALIYIGILALVLTHRQKWIEAPVVKFLANLLMEK